MFEKIRKMKNKKGFTLVELIVVLVILAILAALLIPALTGAEIAVPIVVHTIFEVAAAGIDVALLRFVLRAHAMRTRRCEAQHTRTDKLKPTKSHW